jgi:Tol biopolymer transport system component/DNA-binding winged helix-turn-helix (wHTH) protein
MKTGHLYDFGPFRLDAHKRLLWRDSQPVALAPKAIDTLLLLVANCDRVLEKDELMSKLWPNTFVEEGNLALNISVLRRALGEIPSDHHYIVTVPGRGYRFVAQVREANEEADELIVEKRTVSRVIVEEGEAEQEPTEGRKQIGEAEKPGFELPSIASGASSLTGRGGLAPLEATLQVGGVREPRPEPGRESPGRNWPVALVASIALAALAVAYLFRPTLPPPQVLSSTQITNDGQPKFSMATDGTRVYFESWVGGALKLYQVSTTGGPSVPIDTAVESPVLLGISPDHSQLLVTTDTGFARGSHAFAVPVVGGSPRPLNGISVDDAAWSPNGRQLFYTHGNDLYLANTDGVESRKLSTVEGLAFKPRWSPDGEEIRFSVYKAGFANPSIWEISAAGEGLRQFLPGWNNPPWECCGVWSPDGKYFFFRSGKGGTRNVWAIREGGSAFYKVNHQPVQVTTGPADIFETLPSLDGKKLFVITSQDRGKLMRYDARTSQFVPYLNGISAGFVDFSRDGKWMAYVQYPELTLWRSKIDGSDRVQLTYRPMRPLGPRWSPDGAQIAFWGVTPEQGWHAYLMAADGTGTPQPIPSVPGEVGEMSPGWSPDGKSLVFSGAPPVLTLKSNPTAIHIMDVDTRKVLTLPGSVGLCAPLWSHDGRYIAAQPNGDNRRLTVYDLSAGKWSDLGVDLQIGDFEWSRDSQAIYFLGFPKGQPAGIFKVRLSDHQMEQAASLAHFREAPGMTGNWMGIAPDNSILLVEDVGTQDIYALDVVLPW